MKKKQLKSMLCIVLIAGAVISAVIQGSIFNKKLSECTNRINTLQQHNKDLTQKNNDLKTEIKKVNEVNKKLKDSLDKSEKQVTDMMQKVSFNSEDVTEPSNATVYHLKKGLKGTGLYDLAPAFVEAEKEYGVNALFLAGIVANESKWGNSDRAKSQNNLSGYAVYNRGSEGRTFSSKEQSIMETAKLLRDNYLNSKGSHYEGKSVEAVNTNYCQKDGHADYSWSRIVTNVANQITNKINRGGK